MAEMTLDTTKTKGPTMCRSEAPFDPEAQRQYMEDTSYRSGGDWIDAEIAEEKAGNPRLARTMRNIRLSQESLERGRREMESREDLEAFVPTRPGGTSGCEAESEPEDKR